MWSPLDPRMNQYSSGTDGVLRQMITYAIGDVHGCADQLDRLLVAIAVHHSGRTPRLVLLGDYVDRGPDSAAVIRRIRELSARSSGSVTCLAGNHEELMLSARRDARANRTWIANGGDATLASYGTTSLAGIPTDDLNWLSALPTLHEDAFRYFVHAGLEPGLPARASDPRVRLWTREPFLTVEHNYGKHVVHGHTPQRSGLPDRQRFRTNLDTGAVFTGVLTAGVFTDEQAAPIAFLQSTPQGAVRELAARDIADMA